MNATLLLRLTGLLFFIFLLLWDQPVQAELFERVPPKDDIAFEGPPLAQNDYERKVFGILKEIALNRENLTVPMHDGRFLRILAETSNAKNVVEIGTGAGYSAIWIGLGSVAANFFKHNLSGPWHLHQPFFKFKIAHAATGEAVVFKFLHSMLNAGITFGRPTCFSAEVKCE